MRLQKLKYCIPVALLVVVLAASAVYAASMYRLSYVEKFSTDAVDICIQELSAVRDGEDGSEQQLAEANRDLSYIPRIINRAADCYVRAKIEINMDGNCESPLDLDDIYGLDKDWLCKGEYFYYTKIINKGDYVDLFQGLHIPEDWSYGDVENISIAVKAEAIQSRNFNPDFNKNLPWGAVEMKEISAAQGSECVEVIPISSVANVEYDSTGGFQCSTKDLFDDFGSMMPGDCCEKTVNLKNTSDNMLKASLKITAGNSILNEKMQLKVFSEGTELYNGTVAATNSDEELEITDIPEGKTGKLTLQVYLPPDADNSYSNAEDDIIWELNVEEIADESVQTGDFSSLTPYAIVAGFALLLMICAVTRKKRGGNETHN